MEQDKAGCIQAIVTNIPMGRTGDPEEIGHWRFI
jgi:hypothetical protein